MRLLNTVCLSTAMVLVLAGCAATGTTSPTPTETSGPAASKDPLALWLAQAPKPEVVACSVDKAAAPEAVARFDALSANVSTLYRRVYDDALKASSAPAADNAISAEGLGEALRDAADWKAAAQSAVTAQYQKTLQEIASQRKALTDYIEALRTDNTISNMASRLRQTHLLTQMGNDSLKLGRQLKDSEEGARLVLRRRIAATLGK